MVTMALGPPYIAPPIIEAVVQISFVEPLSEPALRKTVKRARRDYANQAALAEVEVKVDFGRRVADFTDSPQARLSSQDEADVFQLRASTFTWSRLAPYQGWDSFISRVGHDFEATHHISGHRKIEKIGVRYINRLDVPRDGTTVRYEDYLNVNIALPDHWSVVENYGWRFERSFADFTAIVQSAIIEPELQDYGAFLLDIDIIAAKDLPVKLSDVFTKLEAMRVLKNEIFETCVSDQARASFS